MAREEELLDFMGKDAEKGKEVRTQWYNYTRGLGASAEEAQWNNRSRHSSDLAGQFLSLGGAGLASRRNGARPTLQGPGAPPH